MIRIVTDSTCDLPEAEVARHRIHVVPIIIAFGTESYREGVTIDPPTFYRRIEEEGVLPTTSQPSPGDFAEAYRALAAEGADTILSLHVTGKLSGTCRSAEMAAEMVKDLVRVYVFDSLAGSAALGYMALEAARMAEKGADAATILSRLEAIRRRVHFLLTLQDLRFAQMSGRVGRLQGALASLLNVKPIIYLEDGLLDVAERVRTRKRAVDRMIEMMKERVGTSLPVRLAVVHAEAPEEAQMLLERALQTFNAQESFLEDLAISLAVHFGPGTLGLIAYSI